MLLFALFTVGYFFGVFTVLLIFPPQVKEIEEQEVNAKYPSISISESSSKAEDQPVDKAVDWNTGLLVN